MRMKFALFIKHFKTHSLTEHSVILECHCSTLLHFNITCGLYLNTAIIYHSFWDSLIFKSKTNLNPCLCNK